MQDVHCENSHATRGSCNASGGEIDLHLFRRTLRNALLQNSQNRLVGATLHCRLQGGREEACDWARLIKCIVICVFDGCL